MEKVLGEGKKNMKSQQSDTKTTFQARIDKGWQQILMLLRAKTGRPVKGLIEDALVRSYGIDKKGDPYVIDN